MKEMNYKQLKKSNKQHNGWPPLTCPPPDPPSKPLRFEQYTSTRLLAQFDDDLDLQQVTKVSMRISTGNVLGPRYKIRLLRVRLTPLERPDRSVVVGGAASSSGGQERASPLSSACGGAGCDLHSVQGSAGLGSVRFSWTAQVQQLLLPLLLPRPPICRFDIIMEENTEVAFRPLPCSSHL